MNFNAGDKAEITIGKNAVFSGNSAGKTGGAVANWGGSMRLGEGASLPKTVRRPTAVPFIMTAS